MIKIFNIRKGLATNSSSSHSMIRASGLKSDLRPVETWSIGQYGFGWGNFTLADRESKLKYLAVALKGVLGEDKIRQLCELPDDFDLEGSYIDHDSDDRVFAVSPDRDYLEALKAYLIQDDVVILGGNDNSDGHPLNGYDTPADRPVYFSKNGESKQGRY